MRRCFGTAEEEQIGALPCFDTADGSCTAQLELANASEPKTMPDDSMLLVASGSGKGKSLYSLTALDADSLTLTEQTKQQKADLVKAFLQPLDGVPTDELVLYGMGGILRCDPATGELEELLDWQPVKNSKGRAAEMQHALIDAADPKARHLWYQGRYRAAARL